MKPDKNHWEKIYAVKQPHEMSWTQEIPAISMDYIRSFHLPKTSSIMDIGGGNSNLVDHLLEEGYQNITVLDISEQALRQAKERLGPKSALVQWIVSDITLFQPQTQYDLWHDRAVFHFLTEKEDVEKYISVTAQSVKPGGYLVIGTFSEKGPAKCSGLDVQRYSEDALTMAFQKEFEIIPCRTEDHITPFKTMQNFLFCSFKRKSTGI